jgi:hypothetical protein
VTPWVVTLPGFLGSADQPLLVKLCARLGDVRCLRLALPRGRPSPGLARELASLEAQVSKRKGPLVLVGRSFGGRVAVRFAVAHPERVAALVLLGFPVRPPGKRRPEDEAALAAVQAPLLVVQGRKDPLGPPRVLKACLPPQGRVEWLEGAGHSFGRREGQGLDAAGEFIRQHRGQAPGRAGGV